MTSPLKIIYVLGRGRSGSTFLEKQASKMLGATMLGEARLWPKCYRDDHICGCGQPKTACAFWNPIIETLPDRSASESAFRGLMGRKFLSVLLLPKRLAARAFPKLHSLVGGFYQHVSKTSKQAIFIDSSKNPAYALLLDQCDEMDVHLLHIVRHPLGVVYSWKRQRQRSQDVVLYRQHKSLALAALEWSASNALAMVAKWRAQNKHITLRYEDLGDADLTVLTEMFETPGMSNQEPLTQLDHVMSGNPGSAAKSDTFSADSEWKTGLNLWEKLAYGFLTYPIYVLLRPSK